jgi:hypothetical protein
MFDDRQQQWPIDNRVSPPSAGFIKNNTDACFSAMEHHGTLYAVMHDSYGIFMRASTPPVVLLLCGHGSKMMANSYWMSAKLGDLSMNFWQDFLTWMTLVPA